MPSTYPYGHLEIGLLVPRGIYLAGDGHVVSASPSVLRREVAIPEHGLLVYRRLRGTPLLDTPTIESRHLVHPLAQFLSELHRVPRP